MQLSIIIVNWNSANYLKESLESIYRQTTGIDFEIIVVDNGSFDGVEKVLKDKYPQIKYIQSMVNIGFARANNLGAQYSTGDKLLFLNPDTKILDSAINILFSYIEAIEDAGAIGAKLINSDGSLQISCIQRFPTILNQILDFEVMQVRFPKLKIWGIDPLFDNNSHPKEVEVISGACMMIRRDMFEKVGMFSTEYFMYCEDVDLCYKMRKAGRKNYFVGGAKIIHHGGGSTRKNLNSYFEEIMVRESIYRFLRKYMGKHYAEIYKISLLPTSVLRIILILFLSSYIYAVDSKIKYSQSLNKWIKILKWSLGRETWAKK